MCRIGNQSVDKESTLVVAGDRAEGDAGSHCLMNGLLMNGDGNALNLVVVI